MNTISSDAFVFFGATGDLAYKKVFPALQNMVLHGTLNVPVIGVAKSGWNLDQLKERARQRDGEWRGRARACVFPPHAASALHRW
ncbi:MAG TPA: hypothetical protein VK473_04510 [Terriglobales bacterium]|nr:hypothetical protein [Terriglobales bacterium]